MNICLEKFSTCFKVICLGKTEWQDYSSCELLHKKKRHNRTASKEEVLQILYEDWTNAGKTA